MENYLIVEYEEDNLIEKRKLILNSDELLQYLYENHTTYFLIYKLHEPMEWDGSDI